MSGRFVVSNGMSAKDNILLVSSLNYAKEKEFIIIINDPHTNTHQNITMLWKVHISTCIGNEAILDLEYKYYRLEFCIISLLVEW